MYSGPESEVKTVFAIRSQIRAVARLQELNIRLDQFCKNKLQCDCASIDILKHYGEKELQF